MATNGLPRLSHGVSKRWRASERYLTFTETFYVWEFSPESQLKGFNLAFEKEFLLTFFYDPHFLDRFPNS